MAIVPDGKLFSRSAEFWVLQSHRTLTVNVESTMWLVVLFIDCFSVSVSKKSSKHFLCLHVIRRNAARQQRTGGTDENNIFTCPVPYFPFRLETAVHSINRVGMCM